jgi:hypothetical protein
MIFKIPASEKGFDFTFTIFPLGGERVKFEVVNLCCLSLVPSKARAVAAALVASADEVDRLRDRGLKLRVVRGETLCGDPTDP